VTDSQTLQEVGGSPEQSGGFTACVIARPDPALPIVESVLVQLPREPKTPPALSSPPPPASPAPTPHPSQSDWMGPARCGNTAVAARRARDARAVIEYFFALTPISDDFETKKARARALIAPLNPEERALLWPFFDWIKAIATWDGVPESEPR